VNIDPKTGVLSGADQVPSPNFDSRPEGVAADLIVVHGISLPPGEFGGPWIDHLFTNNLPPDAHPYFASVANQRVSAHLCIRRDGTITQYVPFHERAWHAGQSSYEGRIACNDFSVGIELEGADTIAYDERQYRALARAVAALCSAYPTLTPGRLTGHSDISPGRKTDPGPAFDWALARRLIASSMKHNPPL
jgi:N-acetyl-anhydromuramoyl-L-alanine amidase